MEVEFRKYIESGTVLIDFYSDACAPCKQLSPVIDEVSKELTDIDVHKCNIEEYFEAASQLRVLSVPMLCLFKDGKLVATKGGFAQKEEIKEWINNV